MKILSYTQEYFLCAVSGKGNISGEGKICLIVSGITELIEHGYITRDGKEKLACGKEWDDGLPHLKPLYENISALKKPRRITDVVTGYSGKRFNELYSAIGASLLATGYADETVKQGLIKETMKYIPKIEAVKKIVEKIRAEFFSDTKLSNGVICLAALLDISGIIRKYFSKFERPDVKKRIKEARESEAYTAVKKILDEITAVFVCVVAATTASG